MKTLLCLDFLALTAFSAQARDTNTMQSQTLAQAGRSGICAALPAGDSIVELVDAWHHGVNDGDLPAEINFFHASVKGMPVTVESLAHPRRRLS
jgi:hypothetical protein